jgi:hypothetical protein
MKKENKEIEDTIIRPGDVFVARFDNGETYT